MNILIGALDWGLGHTTRVIQIIKQFDVKENTLYIAGSKKQLLLFREHFPRLKFLNLPGVSPRFSRHKNQVIPLLAFLPGFIFSILLEKLLTIHWHRKYCFDSIISDNRYGLFLKNIESSIITHQLSIKTPFPGTRIEMLINKINQRALNKFHNCWIPDFPMPASLSGELGNPPAKLKCKIHHIGPLSRLALVEPSALKSPPELLVIISGPENQRTLFEKIIVEELKKQTFKGGYFIVRGLPKNNKNPLPKSVNHLPANQLRAYIEKARYIICRSGYSTIMDLTVLGKTAMLVPTPGQTEQEYLAEYLHSKKLFRYTRQSEINIAAIVSDLDSFCPEPLLIDGGQ